MKAFYKISVTKQSEGTAIVHREPPLQGEIITKISDASTQGDFKIIALECDAEQHALNLAYPGVVELKEADAIKLAAKYQPKRSLKELDPATRKEVKVDQPAVDLKQLLKFKDERAALAASGAAKASPKKRAAKPRK